MKGRTAQLTRITRAALAASALWACGGDSDSTGPSPTGIVAAVVVEPAVASIDSGATLQLTATVRTAQGNEISRPVEWSSSNPAIVSVSSSGVATAHARGGPVTIMASSEGKSGEARITVPLLPAVVRSVIIRSSVDTIVLRGRTAQLTATARDAQGNAIGGRQVLWSSGNPSIATVNPAGILTAVGAGRVTINADVDGVRGTLAIRIITGDLAPVSQIAADAYLRRLAEGLSTATRTAAQGALAALDDAVASGNVAEILGAAATIRSLAGSAQDPTDRVLLATLMLFMEQIERSIDLD